MRTWTGWWMILPFCLFYFHRRKSKSRVSTCAKSRHMCKGFRVQYLTAKKGKLAKRFFEKKDNSRSFSLVFKWERTTPYELVLICKFFLLLKSAIFSFLSNGFCLNFEFRSLRASNPCMQTLKKITVLFSVKKLLQKHPKTCFSL